MNYNIKPHHEQYNLLNQTKKAKSLKSRDRYLVMIPHTGQWEDLTKEDYKEYIKQLNLIDPHEN